MKKIIFGILSLLISILLGIIAYNFLIYLYPPITEDGHKYMPTQNLFISFLISLVLFPIIYFFISKFNKRNM